MSDKLKRGRKITHGMTKTQIYKLWSGMISRCHSEKNKAYSDYGGRGIYVCEAWRNSFINFYRDMGEMPKSKMLDRIDNDGPYSKENCRWSTAKASANNRRNTVYVTINGATKTLHEWIDFYGLNGATIRRRIYVQKWSHVDAITKPINHSMYLNRFKKFDPPAEGDSLPTRSELPIKEKA